MFNEQCKTRLSQYIGKAIKKGDFGIEIEIEGRHLEGVEARGWSNKREDSLRNGGVEFITNGPVPYDGVLGRVDILTKAIKDQGAKPNLASHLGSTHIHANMLNETFETIMGTAVLWTIVEPIAMRLCGPLRDGNLFCLPSYDAGDMLEFIETFCKFVDTRGAAGRFHRGKYSALNFGRMLDLGTLEFRCFPTSIDPKEIHQWCMWIYNLRALARNAKDKTFKDAVRHAEQNPYPFLESVMGNPLAIGMKLRPDTVPKLIDFGAAQAYELARVIRKWKNKPINVEADEDTIEVKQKKAWKHAFARDLPEPPLVIDDQF